MYLYDPQNNRWLRHTQTSEYRQRRRRIKDVWLYAGLGLACLPFGAQVILALLLTFVSFCYLDEVPYRDLAEGGKEED